MSAELTPWIKGLEPSRRGAYKRDGKRVSVQRHFSYWTGKHWGTSSETAHGAERVQNVRSAWQDLPWRGLASDPSKKPKRK